MLTLESPDKAEAFVETQKSLGNDVRWDNYDLVFFKRAPYGATAKTGAFRNGTWGIESRVPVNNKGTWEVDYKYVRRAGSARN